MFSEAIPEALFSCSMSANRQTGPAFGPGLFVGSLQLPSRSIVGPDAVLVAGSGLIIRLRKDTVGSTPTRPTKTAKACFAAMQTDSARHHA
ncbi:hypothetical protein PCAR4_440084 [Paraburkholderia caribensis]|nr:hypothetical protein PCAR4_440084 [Paraburkholderia caribensis]